MFSITPFHDLSFFFNDTATTEIYTLSLHDALPIYWKLSVADNGIGKRTYAFAQARAGLGTSIVKALAQQLDARVEVSSCWADRKSTRLNSSHANISYAVFCLK